jgi:carbamoyltransferase
MLMLGVSSFTHDAAAALFEDGVIKAAFEDSKLLRSNTTGLPESAMRYCLAKGGAQWHDLDVVAVAGQPLKGCLRQLSLPIRHFASLPVASTHYAANQLGELAKQLSDLRQLKHQNGNCSFKLLTLEHHLTHAASAFFQSPFERSLILTLDEGTDGTAGMVAVGEGSEIRALQSIPAPHSLAWVYSKITELLGFVAHKDEHKTQWLSLEGEPAFKGLFHEMISEPGNPMPRLNRRFVDCDATGRLKLSGHFYQRFGLSPATELLDEERRTLAASLQQACMEFVGSLVEHFRRKYQIQNVCFGGGLFQNVVLVASLEEKLGMNQVFVPPAPGNAGCAVGAGLLVWHSLMKRPGKREVSHVYWGPSYSQHEIYDTLTSSKVRYHTPRTTDNRLDAAIQLLQAGKIVGWFQGPAEFGPRALGNRSLLASPWAPFVKENLNDFIKHREWFRPFAIAIPEEDCSRYFQFSQLCKYMNSLGKLRYESNVLPDGFALPDKRVRLHVVQEKSNPLFWRLLKRFGEIAPAPMLINTSFNLAGEPLVSKPQDAFRSYFCSGIDALVIENFVLSKYAVAGLNKPGITSKPDIVSA